MNNHVNYKFIHKKPKFASYDVIYMSYITKSILTKQIYLSFDPMYLKSSINVKLATKIPKYLSKHMENIFQVLSSKFEIQNKLTNGN